MEQVEYIYLSPGEIYVYLNCRLFMALLQSSNVRIVQHRSAPLPQVEKSLKMSHALSSLMRASLFKNNWLS